MNLDAMYSEQELYANRITQVMSQAGLIPIEEEIVFQEYLEETSRGEKYV